MPIEGYKGASRGFTRGSPFEAMSKGKPRCGFDTMMAETAAAGNRILLADPSTGFDRLSGVRADMLNIP